MVRIQTVKYAATTVLLLLCASFLAHAQDQNISAYLDQRIKASIKARVDQTDPTKQSGPPAAATNSTSLVERSSAPDLLGFGLDLLGLSDSADDKKTATPKTLTFSAYSLKSLFSPSEDPLNPEIYNAKKSRTLRSISFTAGYDVPQNTSARDPIIGVKWLAYNGRDVSNIRNQKEIQTIQKALNPASVDFSRISDEVELYLFAALKNRKKLPDKVVSLDDFEGAVSGKSTWPAILDSLTDEEKKGVDALVSKRISSFVNLSDTSTKAVNKIRSRAQLALAFNTIQRRSGRPDEYSGVVTFDKGMGNNSITFNGSFILTKTPAGKDSKGGQFAAAIHIPLQAPKVLGYTDPLLLSIEGNGKSMTGATPMYVAQAKLTIPITFLPGMEIPISVSVANRTEFVKEKEVRGKFGFTFDVSKAWKAFRDSFMPRE